MRGKYFVEGLNELNYSIFLDRLNNSYKLNVLCKYID